MWRILDCSDSVVYFRLFRQCGVFWIALTVWCILDCSDSVAYFGLFRQCGVFWIVPTVWCILDCSDSVAYFGLFRQCGVFWIVPPCGVLFTFIYGFSLTLWYLQTLLILSFFCVAFLLFFAHKVPPILQQNMFWSDLKETPPQLLSMAM